MSSNLERICTVDISLATPISNDAKACEKAWEYDADENTGEILEVGNDA